MKWINERKHEDKDRLEHSPKPRRILYWAGAACIVVIASVFLAQRLLPMKSSMPGSKFNEPKSLVTTIKGNAQTTRAFNWMTDDSKADEWLQIAEVENREALEDLQTGNFSGIGNEDHVMSIPAKSLTITLADGSQRWVHEVEATGLQAGTSYVYRVGSDTAGWSSPAVFKTENEQLTKFTFINVTDSQGLTETDFEIWGATLDKAFQSFPDAEFLIHNGDLTEEPENERGWEWFFDKGKTWLTRYPFMPVTGNHDEVEGIADKYTSHFNLPEEGAEGSIPETVYSFDYGNAHFIFLNTESNIEGQSKWLREDLSKSKAEWNIVAMHRPAYGGNQFKKVKEWTELFDEFGVDLVLQGHNHEYSRSFPLRAGEIVQDGEGNGEGTVYVVTNTSGPKLNKLKKDKFYHAVHFQNGQQMFAGITINGNTLTYQAYDIEGKRLDEFLLRHE